jgi:Flp pilus assembly protein TadD
MADLARAEQVKLAGCALIFLLLAPAIAAEDAAITAARKMFGQYAEAQPAASVVLISAQQALARCRPNGGKARVSFGASTAAVVNSERLGGGGICLLHLARPLPAPRAHALGPRIGEQIIVVGAGARGVAQRGVPVLGRWRIGGRALHLLYAPSLPLPAVAIDRAGAPHGYLYSGTKPGPSAALIGPGWFAGARDTRWAELDRLLEFSDLVGSGETKAAIRFAQQWSEQEPSAIALRCLGDALQSLRLYDDAVLEYQRALAADPHDAQLWEAHGVALVRVGRYEAAAQSFDRARALDEFNFGAWFHAGFAAAESGQLDAAADALRRAVAVEPARAEAWHRLGRVLLARRADGEAVVALSEAVRLRPNDADAWYARGLAQYRLGLADDAAAAFDEARRLQPELASEPYGLGSAYRFEPSP